jgi:hypothetical protein
MNLGIKTSTYFQFRSKTKWFGAVAVGSLPAAFSAFGEKRPARGKITVDFQGI